MTVCTSCGHENREGAKFCEECGAALESAAPAREQRKTVTVLFCDVTGSTSLGESTDPEALRALLARYFERMKGIVESHGGSVEKFIGDAVMAVFGVPQVHEDDALRGVRAAVEMRDALPELGVQARIGVNTGEVVTGTEERLATGDAVNVAARLEQAAQPGEILIGAETLGLVRDAVEVKEVEPLELKGKTERVPAFRLLDVSGELERIHATRFVGRASEIGLIHEAWKRASDERSCQLVTIVGEPGVGKSRLVAEALSSIPVPVVRGRCLSYGEGITYWPVVEMVKQLDALPSDEAAARAIRSLLGESEQSTTSDEIAWAVRKLLEERAPLVIVFDDIHWAEDTFLDLIEHVALFTGGASLLVVCMARVELAERRPEWVTLRLEPLPVEAVVELIPDAIDEDLRKRIERAAGGNPLFVQEMVAMAREFSGEDVVVPPNLQALIAARLDQLESEERSVLQRGAIEGEVFHRGSVEALAEDGQVRPRLAALVRKALVRPDAPQLPGEDAFRFRHLLIRDAAYDALPKAERASLHERFALWLEKRGADLVELEEILGYHLEQAIGYREELGQEVPPEFIQRARKCLTEAGRASAARGDSTAEASLLERAAALLEPHEIDLALEAQLTEALYWGGRGDDAIRRAVSLAERGATAGDRVAELCGRVREMMYRTFREPEGATERLEALITEALPFFQEAGNHVALFVAYQAAGQVGNMRARADEALEAFERAADQARRAGFPERFEGWRALFRVMGTTPATEALAWIDELEEVDHWTLRQKVHALAMLGRFDEANALSDSIRAELVDRGAQNALAGLEGFEGLFVALLAGDPAPAAERAQRACAILEELGDRSVLSSVAGHLARVLCVLERFDEAERWAGRAAELGASDDALTQYLWRQAKARVLADRGEHEEAQRLAREAIEIAEATDFLEHQADAYLDLAEVLEVGGKDPRPALEEALARYERKENLVMAERVRERLDSLLQLHE